MGSDPAAADRRPHLGARQQSPGAHRRRSPAAALDAQIAVVISNKAGAAGLERARAAGIEALVARSSSSSPRATTSTARWPTALRARHVSLVCLAGFMRLVGPPLLEAFPNAILNMHPSLLPAFPGVDAQRQALEHGAALAGATVHLVTGELDGGPIVMQSAVPVLDDDTAETLSARILDRGTPHLSRSRAHRPRRPVARGRQTVSPVHRSDDDSDHHTPGISRCLTRPEYAA